MSVMLPRNGAVCPVCRFFVPRRELRECAGCEEPMCTACVDEDRVHFNTACERAWLELNRVRPSFAEDAVFAARVAAYSLTGRRLRLRRAREQRASVGRVRARVLMHERQHEGALRVELEHRALGRVRQPPPGPPPSPPPSPRPGPRPGPRPSPRPSPRPGPARLSE
jgi:hypothetical protein